ncbi:sigma-E processing peptidase SpoIIGA [Bacillaceae bacterium W0354]
MNDLDLYVDLIWLLNLFFDWLVLLTVAWVIRRPYKRVNIFLASLFASLIVPLTLIFNMDWLENPFIKLIYSFGIILIAFRFQSIQQFLIYFFCFYFINFAIGGGLFALHFFLKSNQIDIALLNYVGYGSGISWLFVIICFPIILYFTKGRLQNIAVIKLHSDRLYDVELFFRNESRKIKGFLDTGNQLSHPLSNKPIILVDEKIARTWFDSSLIDRMKHQQINDDDLIKENVNIHYIPFRMAGGDQGFLPVFIIDCVNIYANKMLYSTKKVYVGIHFGQFSNSLNYNCLLHPELFQTKKTKIQHVKGVS